VDPFDFGMKFETLRRLSAVFIDFVVLLAIGMDANRNYDHYVDGHSTKIDEALGNTEWRERWKAVGVRRSDFRPFLASEFSISMASLGYLQKPLDRMKLVRSVDKNCHCITLRYSHVTRWPSNSGRRAQVQHGSDKPLGLSLCR